MTFTETEIRYIEWDYNSMIATEYRRYGECNQCGECCKADIVFKGRREGGIGTDDKEIWAEVQSDQKRMFFKTEVIELNKRTCPSYNDKEGCIRYNDRYAICTTWPFSPRDIALMPSCSYWFDEVNDWKIE